MTAVFRVDASSQMGSGHFMRCLALAQELKSQGASVFFLSSDLNEDLQKRLASENFSVTITHFSEPGSLEDARQTLEFASLKGSDWIVLDGYHFKHDYQKCLKQSAIKLLTIDDFGHASEYCSDLVLNQNAYAKDGYYTKRAPTTRLLLGPSYILFRNEFLNHISQKKMIQKIGSNILLTFGGSDQKNCTGKVIQALGKIKNRKLKVVAIVGALYADFENLKKLAENSPHEVTIVKNTSEMPKYMSVADLAYSAGGSTCYELGLMGVPFMMMATTKDEDTTINALVQRGVGQNLGLTENVTDQQIIDLLENLMADQDKRAHMSAQGQNLIDGLGRQRVFAAMRDLTMGKLTTARLTLEPFDQKFLTEKYVSWLNDPEVVRYSEQRHRKHTMKSCLDFFQSFRGSPNLFWAITLNENQSEHIGNITASVDIPNGVADVGILMGEKKYWGKGYGLEAWNAVMEFLFQKKEIQKITAGAMSTNLGMRSIMKRSGMVDDGVQKGHFLVDGQPVDAVYAVRLRPHN